MGGDPAREQALLRQLVAGLDLAPTDPQFRPFLCGLMAADGPEERARKLGWVLELAPELRDPILAYMLWQSEPVVRDSAVTALSAHFQVLPELLWRAAVLPCSLRGMWPKHLSTSPKTAPKTPGIADAPCSACHVSIPDGTGHVTLFLALDGGKTPRTALVLLHVMQGFLDAELLSFAQVEHRDRALAEMRRDLDLNEVRPSNVHALLGDLFSLASGQERPPPPKVVDLLPVLWRRDVARIVEGRQPGILRNTSAGSMENSLDWTRKLPLMESWASETALAVPVDGSATNRLEHAYYRIEEERALWRAILRWTAVILSHCAGSEKELALRFVSLVRCVDAGSPLREIPLFRQIALRTVLAGHRDGERLHP